MLQTLIQALMLGMGITEDHIGGSFSSEEKDFMLQTAQLEHKWRLGKKKQLYPERFKDTTGSFSARFPQAESTKVYKV